MANMATTVLSPAGRLSNDGSTERFAGLFFGGGGGNCSLLFCGMYMGLEKEVGVM